MRLALLLAFLAACNNHDSSPKDSSEPAVNWECQIPKGEVPDYAVQLGCWADFDVLASEPLDASIPGARSVKTVIDRTDANNLYFQNSLKYAIHWDFAFNHLSGNGLPIVPDMGTFNASEYYSPTRRFLLGAITYYEEPGIWAYELAPYDTADTGMIETAFDLIRDNAFFGDDLYFHPTSESVELAASTLPSDIPIITTDELFAGVTYQPLNLGTSMGLLELYTEDEWSIETPSFREIVVLETVPDNISVVMGIITQEFQTPLSHLNVLSQNRGTPNMGLRDAMIHPDLLALEGKWVELTVDPFEWTIQEVTQEQADAWWEKHKPEPLPVTPMDLSVTDIRDIELVVDEDAVDLAESLTSVVPAFGGKATNYSAITHIGDPVPIRDGFAIPVWYYNQFMEQNGLWPIVEAMLSDKKFLGDAAVRDAMLEQLRDTMVVGTLDPTTLAAVVDKIETEFPGVNMRFRSSTNAEDITGFNGAGLYESHTAQCDDLENEVAGAMREVWASIWTYRAYEEREYYSIPHMDIGMALLVVPSFPDEEANGVAITANIYDTTGLEPAFYVNVQEGDLSVVYPDDGVTTDQFLYYYYNPGQPIVFLGHSTEVPEGENVLTTSQTYELGQALDAIHQYFMPAYGNSDGSFYGMDVEFKYDAPEDGGAEELWIKQARPYPGWGE